MTILTVVQDVCEVVGVSKIDSLFSGSATDRTKQELLTHANEVAQKIAYDTRDWTTLRKIHTLVGDGSATAFDLPPDYKRMLLTAQVRTSQSPVQPLRFIPDFDQWVERRLSNETEGRGEWTMSGGRMLIEPAPALGTTIKFPYLDKNCITTIPGGTYSDRFANDTDVYRLDERALKLALIVAWKASKGTPMAEDMGTYGDCMTNLMGRDLPSPIIVDRLPISASTKTAYPWQVPT